MLNISLIKNVYSPASEEFGVVIEQAFNKETIHVSKSPSVAG